MVLAAEQASNTAMLGQLKDLQTRDKVEADHAFNCTMTYAGKDVATFIKECILGIVTDGEERDLVLQMIEAVNRFLVKSDKDKDRKVLLSSLGLVHWLARTIVVVPSRLLPYRTRSDPVYPIGSYHMLCVSCLIVPDRTLSYPVGSYLILP